MEDLPAAQLEQADAAVFVCTHARARVCVCVCVCVWGSVCVWECKCVGV